MQLFGAAKSEYETKCNALYEHETLLKCISNTCVSITQQIIFPGNVQQNVITNYSSGWADRAVANLKYLSRNSVND
jgi:hypothetical protein